MANQVFTGALAIIKVKGVVVGLMRNLRISESTRRVTVRGLGTILPQEAPVVEWAGTVSCSFFEIDYRNSGIANAIRRDVGEGNAASTAGTSSGAGKANFEDNLVLDAVGVTLDVYKKVEDAGSPDPNTGLLIPNKKPYATIGRCMIESDNVTIDEGNVAGRDQSFQYLDPIVYNR